MTVLVAPLDSISSLLRRSYHWLRRVLIGCAILLVAITVLEAIRLFELLARIHPALGWTVLLLLTVPVLAWAAYRWTVYLRNPTVLVPPDLPPVEAGWSRIEIERYRSFARRYLRRQSSNPRLPEEARARIPVALEAVEAQLPAEDLWDPVRAARTLSARVEEAIGSVVEPLDLEAKRLIRRAAVEVAVATAVSPSILMDGLITLTRNVDLMSRLANLYYGRPGLLGTLRILRDVFGSAITAGALEIVSDHVTGAVSEMAGSWTSRLLGPLGQGMVNGVVTMRFGAAARKRCRSLGGVRIAWRPWRLKDYRRAMGKLKDWLRADMGPDFVQPMFRWLSPASSPDSGRAEETDETGGRESFWQRLFRRRTGKGDVPEKKKPEEENGAVAGDPLLDSDLMD